MRGTALVSCTGSKATTKRSRGFGILDEQPESTARARRRQQRLRERKRNLLDDLTTDSRHDGRNEKALDEGQSLIAKSSVSSAVLSHFSPCNRYPIVYLKI